MKNFRIGDKVRRTESGGNDLAFDMIVGDVYTVRRYTGGYLEFEEVKGDWLGEYFEKVDKNPKKHPHVELIIAWANGAIIEQLSHGKNGKWWVVDQPSWAVNSKFRLKPKAVEPVTEKRRIAAVGSSVGDYLTWYTDGVPNVEVTYNPETKQIPDYQTNLIMELKIKKCLRTNHSQTSAFSSNVIEVKYNVDYNKATYEYPYVDTYKHELNIRANGHFNAGDTPDHSIARNGLMSFLYSDIIHELYILANEISPRNTDALKRVRQMQQELSSWDSYGCS